jgi:Leucine-rich repeat (LRR) protein
LTQLSIAGLKYMTSIEPNAFQHLPCLEKLSLENNSIDQIEPAAFNNLNKLMRLELRGNKLTNFRFAELPASAEPYCLKVLDLSCNQLIFIPKRSVTNLPTSLVNLNLGENFIEAIESGAFKDLVNLRSLNLAEMLCETLNVDDILNRDTANLRYLDIRGANANMKILCHDSSHQNAEGASVNEKRTQSEGVLKFPVKNLRNRLVVYANHSRIQPIEGVLQVVVDYEEID